VKNGVFAVCLSLAVHAALAVALLAYLRHASRPETRATLDLSSVELSFAEKDDETAVARPVMPTEPQAVVPQKPQPMEPPPRETEKLPLPPDPTALKLPEPLETPPEMRTPERPVEKPPERQPERTKPAPTVASAVAPAPAVAPRQAKVDAPPRPRRTIRPVYPKGARQRGEQGEVTLEIAVAADGTVTDAQVVGSCGFSELDAAAVAAARGARFVPARSGDRPVSSVVRLKIAFRLK